MKDLIIHHVDHGIDAITNIYNKNEHRIQDLGHKIEHSDIFQQAKDLLSDKQSDVAPVDDSKISEETTTWAEYEIIESMRDPNLDPDATLTYAQIC